MKKMVIILGCIIALCGFVQAVTDKELTYEYLVQDNYTDHVKHFKKIFDKVKVNSFLEFGLGLGTKYFLDHATHVTSIELLLPDQTDKWFRLTTDLFAKATNWTYRKYTLSASAKWAEAFLINEKKDPALYDSTYLLELNDLCDELFLSNSFDVAFVDSGIHMRADIVNILFQKVPVIAAHDTSCGQKEYGWYKIQTPSNYEKIVFSETWGTTFWVRKDKHEVILALKGYLSEKEQRPLRIFFPNIHPGLFTSMAKAFSYLGHTLLAPGQSFNPKTQLEGPKIKYGIYPENYSHKGVEIIENDTIFNNPPDVIFINCKEVENDCLILWRKLKKATKKDIKLAFYAGNENVPFQRKYVKNLLTVDATTEQNFSTAPNVVFWIPWIDYDNLQFQEPSDALVMNSFLAFHYSIGFPKGAAAYNEIKNGCKLDFPLLKINSPEYIEHKLMMPMIDNSFATLHCKDSEGFGYTIIESLAKGKPVFLNRTFSKGKRLMNWCIEGKTAFFFDNYEEFKRKFERYYSDVSLRRDIQRTSATTIRRLINNKNQILILENFLQNLQ